MQSAGSCAAVKSGPAKAWPGLARLAQAATLVLRLWPSRGPGRRPLFRVEMPECGGRSRGPRSGRCSSPESSSAAGEGRPAAAPDRFNRKRLQLGEGGIPAAFARSLGVKPQGKPRRQQALRKRCTQLAPRLQPKGQEGEDASPCHDSGGSVQINTPPRPISRTPGSRGLRGGPASPR